MMMHSVKPCTCLTSLGVRSLRELHLDFTLPTGQSFLWHKTGPSKYTGCIGPRLVSVEQDDDGDVHYEVLARGAGAEAAHDRHVLRDYFNLDVSLTDLADAWALSDPHFARVYPYFQGARMLRQDPVECLFQFICSSNNHITRIHGMVQRLCQMYGTPLTPDSRPSGTATITSSSSSSYHAFPTLEQLAQADEDALREAGFGYRAKFVTGSVSALQSKPGGGSAWLLGLRRAPYGEAATALAELPGVGPKVAACVCLFSLDKHAAIPVDTHVWQLAVRHYLPHLSTQKSLTKSMHATVEQALVKTFGEYAGWAHNTLFISELAHLQHRLPPHLQRASTAAKTPRKRKGDVPAVVPAAVVSGTPPAPTSHVLRQQAAASTPAGLAVLTPVAGHPVHGLVAGDSPPKKRSTRRRVTPG